MEDNEIKGLIESVRNEVARVEGKIPKEKEPGDKEDKRQTEQCPECGGNLSQGVKYCPYCGIELEWD